MFVRMHFVAHSSAPGFAYGAQQEPVMNSVAVVVTTHLAIAHSNLSRGGHGALYELHLVLALVTVIMVVAVRVENGAASTAFHC